MNRFGFILLLAWVGLTLIVLDQAPAPAAWTAWPPDFCRGTNCYCEPLRLNRLVAQPAAAFSNLGFLAAAAVIIGASLRGPAGLEPTRSHGVVYGAALIGAGLFSFFYHASLTRAGDFLDLIGVYLFVSFLVIYNVHRLRPLQPARFGLLYAALVLALAAALRLAYNFQHLYIVALVLSVLGLEALVQRGMPANDARLDRRWLAAALGLFGLGVSVWLLDSGGRLPCWPAFPITWHAVWHLSAAGAAMLMYSYYRSGKPAPTASA